MQIASPTQCDEPSDSSAETIELIELELPESPCRLEVERLKFRVKSLEAQLQGCLQAEDALKAALFDQIRAALKPEFANLSSISSSSDPRTNTAENRVRVLENQIAEIHRSTSWSLTRPIRYFKRLLRALEKYKSWIR